MLDDKDTVATSLVSMLLPAFLHGEEHGYEARSCYGSLSECKETLIMLALNQLKPPLYELIFKYL